MISKLGSQSGNTFAYLAAGSRGRERGLAAQGLCEITSQEPKPKKQANRNNVASRVSQKKLFTAPKELSPEQQLARYEAETLEESFRGTDADPRHPIDRSLAEKEYYNQLNGISLGENTPDDLEAIESNNFTLNDDPMHISHPVMSVLEEYGLLDDPNQFQIRKPR